MTDDLVDRTESRYDVRTAVTSNVCVLLREDGFREPPVVERGRIRVALDALFMDDSVDSISRDSGPDSGRRDVEDLPRQL